MMEANIIYESRKYPKMKLALKYLNHFALHHEDYEEDSKECSEHEDEEFDKILYHTVIDFV